MDSELKTLCEEAKCMFCNKPMKEPKILKCFHTFCKNCVAENAQLKEAGKTFDCLTCKTRIDLTELNDFDSLQSSRFHSRILQVLPLTSTESIEELSCSCKKRRTPVSFCFECNRCLCEKCLNAHDDFIEGHKVVPLNDISQDDLMSLMHTQSKCEKKKHKKEILQFYCKTCSTCVCQTCILEGHQGHDLVDVEPLASQERNSFSETLEKLKGKAEEEEQNLEIIEETVAKIKANAEETKTKVCKVAEELIEFIEENKNELLKQIEERIEVVITKKSDQEYFLEKTFRAVNLSSTLIEHGSNFEIMSSKGSMEDRCFELIGTKTTSTRLDPRVMFIPCEGPSALRAFGLGSIGSIHTAEPSVKSPKEEVHGVKGTFVTQTDPSSCVARVDTELEASRKTKITVLTKTSSGKPSKGSGDVIEVNISPDEDVKFLKVSERLVDKYEVEFSPVVPGRYRAVIKINGKHVYNSPLDLAVQPQELKVVGEFEMKGMDMEESLSPWGIAVNNTNTRVAVAGISSNTIAVFNMEGELQRRIGSRGRGCGQLDQPHGITFLDEDKLAVAERGNHRVQIFSCVTGEYVTSFGKPGHEVGEFYSPFGIHVNERMDIFVCDYGNRRIQIFSDQGDYDYQIHYDIESPENMSPVAVVSSGPFIIVSENNNPVLRVFTRQDDTTAPRSIALGSTDGELSQPLGLATDYIGNIIVCDQSNRCIQKVSIDGRFVGMTCENIDPMYLAVMHDGRVMVTDPTADRIYIVE